MENENDGTVKTRQSVAGMQGIGRQDLRESMAYD
jgi:hypothetical protein